MGRNETLSFTIGPETPSFNVAVLGISLSRLKWQDFADGQKSTTLEKISRLGKPM